MKNASFRLNASANLVSQVLVGLMGLIALPWMVRVLGKESFALASFFVTIQLWISLLDLGLGQALARQTARLRVKAISVVEYTALYKAVSRVFIIGTVLAIGVIGSASNLIADKWLTAEQLPLSVVAHALTLIGVAASLRWFASLYRGVIAGHERFVWLSTTNLIFSVFRWFVVLVFVVSVASEPAPRLMVFMAYQVALACVELATYGSKARSLTRRTIGARPRSEGLGAWGALRTEMVFSLNLAFSSLVWTMVTQSDRLTLSGILSLSEYAIFSLAVTLAATVLMISTPLGAVILPRLTKMFSSQTGQHEQSGYVQLTRAVTHVVMPVGLTLICVCAPFLRTWTGDPELAVQAVPIARLYLFGNLILAVSAFGFYLQYAIGKLRLHTIANIMMGLILVPLQIALAMRFGAVGAGLGWVTVNLLLLTLWLPYVHHVYLPGVHWQWLLHGVLIPSLIVGSVSWAVTETANAIGPLPDLITIVLVAGCSMLASAASWRFVRPSKAGLGSSNL